MNCFKVRRNLHAWLDGELAGPAEKVMGDHLKLCNACREAADSLRAFQNLLRTSVSAINPSPDFERSLWERIQVLQNVSWWQRFLEDLEAWIPVPSLAQAVAVLTIAFFLGGTGGAFSVWRGNGEVSTSRGITRLSGFQEYKGLPLSSAAGTYLKQIDEEMTK